MAKMIQIRHVPDALHRKLKARAAHQGKSLSDYLLQEIQRTAEVPPMDELMERIARRKPVTLHLTPTEMVRAERDRL